MIHWEDIELGISQVSPLSYTLTAENIKEFAGTWDPFPPHIDEEFAARSPIGQLFAAGVHLLSITIRLSHSIPAGETSAIASQGWEGVRFRRPGIAGDTLRTRVTHIERREGKRPETGLLISRFELINQRDDVILAFDSNVVMLKRDTNAATREA